MSFLKSFLDKVMGPTGEYPDASELNKLNKPSIPTVTNVVPPSAANQAVYSSIIGGVSGVTVTLPPAPSHTWSNITTNVTMGQIVPPSYITRGPNSDIVISFLDNNGNSVVSLYVDGTVKWAKGEENLTEAQRSFASMLTLTLEQKALVTQGMKLKTRDQVFEEVIRMARERGPLSADDLTFMLESSKIIEKLKGTNG